MKFAFVTLGCKVNQYETQVMREAVQRAGHTLSEKNETAEVYVINSCTVTAQSDQKTRQTIRRLRAAHPDAILVLCGCMPQAFPQSVHDLPQVDIVLGVHNKHLLAQALEEYLAARTRIVNIPDSCAVCTFETAPVSNFSDRTRAHVKIEDGCRRFCTYCTIPLARGDVRSKPLEKIQQEVSALGDAGFAEIVLVGINLSAYSTPDGGTLADAVRVAAQPNTILRVRLGSLEPDHLTPALLAQLAAQPKVCPQFHISLQSGCARTLKRMGRHYSPQAYEALCKTLRGTFPDATITTDVMVGFPGETDADFEESLCFVKAIAFEKVHVFPYSRRAGTPAAAMEQQVSKATKQERSRRMLAQTQAIRSAFLQAQIGRTLTVLPEIWKTGTAHGHTANMTPVKIQNCPKGISGLCDVLITGTQEDYCVGTLV